jgi:hypothetical protein
MPILVQDATPKGKNNIYKLQTTKIKESIDEKIAKSVFRKIRNY